MTTSSVHGSDNTGLDDDSLASVEEIRVLLAASRALPDGFVSTLEHNGCLVRRQDRLDDLVEEAGAWEADVLAVDASLGQLPRHDPLRRVRKSHPCVTAMLVDDYTPETLTRTFELGADTFLARSAAAEDFLRLIEQELRFRRDHGTASPRYASPDRLVGESRQMARICALLARAAPSTASVLIGGESGTGKEIIARALHRLSPRRSRPFVALNCGAIPESLLESELFGHEEGAFTGATSSRPGRFLRAHSGTLFLDEIGDLPREMQVKLLRVLQEQSFERVGGSETLSVDVRIVAASNRDLAQAVENGDFRSDLYYRLNVLQLDLPPLRVRTEDVRALWHHFVRRAATAEAVSPPETSAEVLRMLYRYHWPGNVRELENVARHAVTLSSSGTISADRLPGHFRNQLRAQKQGEHGPRFRGMTLEELERSAIIDTYQAVNSVKRAAELLDISERKIYYRLKEYRQQGYLGDDSQAEEHDGERQSDQTDPEQDASPSAEQRPRLVLAEDDEQLRWALRQALRNDYDVVAVSNGRALVDEARSRRPAVILSDVRMPGLDGIQVLRELYNDDNDIPIVLISAYADEATRAQAELLGAIALLDKPIDMQRLRRELQQVVTPA